LQEGTAQTITNKERRVTTEGFSEHKAAFKLDRYHRDAHKYSVVAAAWYPIDTGVFVTGSFDHEVKVSLQGG
jgi:hypothetical protein